MKRTSKKYDAESLSYVDHICELAKINGWKLDVFDDEGIRFKRKIPFYSKEQRKIKIDDGDDGPQLSAISLFLMVIGFFSFLVLRLRKKKETLFFSAEEIRRNNINPDKLAQLIKKKNLY